MRGSFQVRVAFSPTRLAAEHLQSAYDVVTPVASRTIAREDAGGAERDRERTERTMGTRERRRKA